ncbi:MAG: (2Fe-2S) ferredoxin domain-containing protein [Bacteroidales bacterium]
MDKIEIIICLGSSCFSRGNKSTLRVIDEFLKQHHLKQYVEFKGTHCFGMCEHGPVIKINDELMKHMDCERAIRVLKAHFGMD